MTALEELIKDVNTATSNMFVRGDIIADEKWFKEWKISLIEELNQKYSVTLRTSSESADNAKSEQSITDEELAAKVNYWLDQANAELSDHVYDRDRVIKELETLFKTYRTMPNSASNNSNEVIVNKLEMASEIAHYMLFESVAKEIGFDEEELFNGENYKPKFQDEFNHLYDNALKLIDRCRIGSNSSSNNSVEHSINQEQMMSQIEDMALHLWNSTYSLSHFQQQLKDCFKQHFKPSKSLDE